MTSMMSTVSPKQLQEKHEDTISKITSSLTNKLANVTHSVLSSSSSKDHTTVASHSAAVLVSTTSSPSTTTTSTVTKDMIDVVNKTIHSLIPVSHQNVSSTENPLITPSIHDSQSNMSMFGQNGSHATHGLPGDQSHDHHLSFLAHSFLFQAVLILAFVVALFAVIYILRKKHLDRLRHHLMPVYNFDPSDDGEDWETELLDDQMVHMPNNDPNPSLNGQLKLDTGLTRGLRIHNNNSNGESTGLVSNGKTGQGIGSPTAASGLLSSSSDSHGSQGRRLYTHERDPIA